MKILFVHSLSPHAAKGGAELSIRFLTEALVAAGHACTVVCLDHESGQRETIRNGVREIRVGLHNLYWPFGNTKRSRPTRLAWHTVDSFNPFMQKTLDRVIEEAAPDVASVHNLPGWSVSAWQALAAREIPIVQVLHDQYLLCASGTMFRQGHNCRQRCLSCRLLRLPHAAMSRHVTAVVGVSQFILERHRAAGLFSAAAMHRVIHNARDAQTLEADTPAQSHETLRFGFIGSLTPAKGIGFLVEAFEQTTVDAELWVAGDTAGDYAQRLIERASDPRIRYLGRTPPAEFFSSIDVLVLPSLWQDTFPGVAFEALIFGCPVIGAAHGGIPEIITHDHNGWLYEPSDPDALKQALTFLAENDEARERFRANALLSRDYFLDTKRWVDAYAEVYDAAIRHAHDTDVA